MRERELIFMGYYSKGRTTISNEERQTSLTQQLVPEPPRSILFELIRHIWVIVSQTLRLRDDIVRQQCIQSYHRKQDTDYLRRSLKSNLRKEQMYSCKGVTTFWFTLVHRHK